MEPEIPTTNQVTPEENKSQGNEAKETTPSAPTAGAVPPTLPDITLLHPNAKKTIELYIDGLGITDHKMDLSLGSEIGDNFSGIIAKLAITGTKNGTPVSRNWIVKTAPYVEALRSMMKVEYLYIREDFIYSEVFPLFKTIETEAKVLEPFDNYPGYILSSLTLLEETIVMEDMKPLGYVMNDKRKPLGLDHVKLAMKTYGKLHALSFAVKTLKHDTWLWMKSNTKNVIIDSWPKEVMEAMQRPFVDTIVALFDPKNDAKHLEKFKKFSDNFLGVFYDFTKKQSDFEVILHGDCWVNNLLWKYHDGKPEKVCIIDWQQSSCASPAADLSYFLFSSTTKEFRDEHYESMLKLYHYSLCEHLNALGVNPDVSFSYEQLKNELREFAGVGLYYSLCLLGIISKDKADIPEWRDDSTNFLEFGEKFYKSGHSAEQDFNTRVKGVIIDFCDYGYLDAL